MAPTQSRICGALSQRLAPLRGVKLGLLDHFDHGLLRLADEVEALAPKLRPSLLLCSVRDPGALQRGFDAFAPEIVIHAAALKHVHLGEMHPGECVLTNLVGVRNVVSAAHSVGAQELILVSSDKAAAPSCVMGVAKRLAELYLHGFAAERRTSMCLSAVRFGNVMGSQGSVVPRFTEQIEKGGPLTLTHPDMECFFLTMDEAVDLILSVSALSRRPGRAVTYVRDMGEPISILRLAQELMARAECEVPITLTGLRPGEKLTEHWFDSAEIVHEGERPGIFEVTPCTQSAHVNSFDISALETMAQSMEAEPFRAHVFAQLAARLRPVAANLARSPEESLQ